MKAMILDRQSPIEEKPLKPADLPVPTPAEDQILVKVSVCGACHTDLDEAEGRLKPSKSPIVPGHQVVGNVVDKGTAVTRHKIGDRVGITWLFSSCGECDFCRSGSENLCAKAQWTGKDADGGYAEFMVIGEDFVSGPRAVFRLTSRPAFMCRRNRISHTQSRGHNGRPEDRSFRLRSIGPHRDPDN